MKVKERLFMRTSLADKINRRGSNLLTVESNATSQKQSLWREMKSIAESKWPCKIRPEEFKSKQKIK